MRRILSAAGVCVLLAGPILAEEPVHFGDRELKSAVESALWVTDPTPDDMLNLTELICTNLWNIGDGIESVTGLEYATNLQTLDLRLNRVTDASPLAGLSSLRYLDFSRNHITDLSPLATLTNLEYLDLHGNGVSDISPLAGLTHLETLILRINQVTDLSALAGLTQLRTLILWSNKISDISPLSHLTNLRELHLGQNAITDISPLLGLTSLTNLSLNANPWTENTCSVCIPELIANNPGIDIQHDCGPFLVSVSSGPGGTVYQPAEEQSVHPYDDSICLEARAKPGFVFLNWSGTYFSGQNPDWLVVRGEHRVKANFITASDTLYVDDDAPQDPKPGDGSVSDPQENGTAEHPFDRIQEAVDVAMDGTSIRVCAGTYREVLDLLGKSLEIKGMDPNDPSRTGWPIIDGADNESVIWVHSDGQSRCSLTGLVLTGGRSGLAGAIGCSASRLTVANCLIAGNRATYPTGAAVYAVNSHITLIHCTIVDNTAGGAGAAVHLQGSDLTVVNSILWANTPRQIIEAGTSVSSIQYSDVAGGWPGLNNTAADPLFARLGYWAIRTDPTVVVGPHDADAVWMPGDYHLQSRAGRWDPQMQRWIEDQASSPCIDAGDPGEPPGPEPYPNGDVVNMGVYGGTSEASKSQASSSEAH